MTREIMAALPEVEHARQKVASHLLARVTPDGALDGLCSSRVGESALLLVLLRKTGFLPAVQLELAGYLRGARPSTELDVLIAAAALNAPAIAVPPGSYFEAFQRSGSVRKVHVFAAILGLFDLVPQQWRTAPDDIAYRGFAIWTELTLCAAKILAAALSGWDERAIRPDLDELRRMLGSADPRGVWEGNVLAHLVALHALHAYRPDDPLVSAGVDILCGIRNSDGGVPFIAGQEVFVTAMAGAALAACGDQPQDMLWRMGDYLAERQLPDGGWGYHRATTQTDVDDTSRCLTFLRATDATRYSSTLDNAERYLAGMFHPSGGFPTYRAGDLPEVDMTAVALIALAPAWTRLASTLTPCVEYLVDSQRADGSFKRGWTLSEASVLLVVTQALRTCPESSPEVSRRVRQALDRGTHRLVTTQHADGGWGQTPDLGSDVLSTSQAVAACAPAGWRDSFGEAARFLLDRQNADGGFTSIPDQAGPRPLPFDFPDLAAVHALTALTALTRSWQPPRPASKRNSLVSQQVRCSS